MLKKRIIPVILLRNGVIVQSRRFKRYQALGNPTAAVERLSSWNSDELIYLDISPSNSYDMGRADLNNPNYGTYEDLIRLIASKCFIPLTFGGKIRDMEDVKMRLKNGADKVTFNTAAIDSPELITKCSNEFGKQFVVVSIDALKKKSGGYHVMKGGKVRTEISPVELAKKVEQLGAGEILLNSVEQDGTGTGFDLDLIQSVTESVKVPIIALGGAGSWEHFEEVLKTDASAVAAANIFQHSENSIYNLKKYLWNLGCNVRKPLKLQTEKQLL